MKHFTAAEKRRALVSALTDSVTTIVERAVLDQVQAFLHGAAGEAPRARSGTPAPRGRVPAAPREAQKVAPPRAAQKVAPPRAAQKIALPKAPQKAASPKALQKVARKAAPKAALPKLRLEVTPPESRKAAPVNELLQVTLPEVTLPEATLPKATPFAPAPLAPTARPAPRATRPAPVERVQAPKATGDVGTAAERILSHVQQNPGALGQEARIALGLAFADWRAGVAKLSLDGKLRKEGNSLLPRYFVVIAPEPFKAVPPIRRKARVPMEQTASL